MIRGAPLPITPTFPGVYVGEIPSGLHTITPVATSIAAFVGRAPMGPVDEALAISSFGDFTRLYGGLSLDYPMSYAVQQFFENGGSEAVIARLFEPVDETRNGYAQLHFPPSSPMQPDCRELCQPGTVGDEIFAPSLHLVAASPGTWGNRLYAAVDVDGITDVSVKQFLQGDIVREDLFNLSLTLTDPRGRQVSQERYMNLTVKQTGLAKDSPNRLDRVLASSKLCRVSRLPNSPPVGAVMGKGGDDGDFLQPQTYLGDALKNTGIYLLNAVSFNLLCIPPDRRISDDMPLAQQDLDPKVRNAAARYSVEKRAIYIVDPPAAWEQLAADGRIADIKLEDLGITGKNQAGIAVGRNAAVYFPRFIGEDVLREGRPAVFAPCGAIAGIIAATDAACGVWKAPAGADAGLAGVTSLNVTLSDPQQGELNPLGVNCLRTFPVIGTVIWGSRTLQGADQFEDDYKYLPVRRLMLFIEDSLYRGTQWAAFERNDESLWSSLRLAGNSFMAELARQGAFYNYLVTCDATTTTPTDIANGIVNIVIQIAPVMPAEFVAIQIRQTAMIAASHAEDRAVALDDGGQSAH